MTRIVAIHNYSSSGSGTYDIDFDFVPFACGNGRIEGSEACDDGNAVDGDGCTACAVDSGYSCSGAPSVCTASAANGTCATATVVSTDTVITGEQIAGGGAPPSGTGCGGGTGNRALYYLVTVPAMGRVAVQTTPGFDIVLVTQDACSDTACTFSTDSAPEAASLVNATGSDVTRVVAVRPYYSSTTSGTFDIAFTYVESIAASCVDTSGATALGVASDDTTSAIAALPFTFDLYGDTVTHYSASSNGFPAGLDLQHRVAVERLQQRRAPEHLDAQRRDRAVLGRPAAQHGRERLRARDRRLRQPGLHGGVAQLARELERHGGPHLPGADPRGYRTDRVPLLPDEPGRFGHAAHRLERDHRGREHRRQPRDPDLARRVGRGGDGQRLPLHAVTAPASRRALRPGARRRARPR
ncbi:MAG: myxococcus cysteine-rich repeat containing protein [Sandaracinaceae bacterium]|nr:myxococcus cysteine-rich repeat containing protein [Sandaracinaceae bacterium]